ncbi:MAG TPA: thioredoxin domain-containing protein, partial [Roseiarcus sp.]
WPLTMFLSPDGKPMLGGTYWPPEPRYGRPSFRQVLQSVDSAWRTQRDQMESRGLTLADHLAKLSELRGGPGVVPADLTRIGDALRGAVDPVHGGLSGAPKFPNAPIFRFFWNEMFRRGDPAFGEAVRAMLVAMNAGGIYDHLGGGYARYSTDAGWLVPHFEKMLYDNAQILELLALVHSLWPDPTFAERARETVGWLEREMRVGDAFAASLDADQDGEEGLFYVWREDDVDAALGDASATFKAAYDVTPDGNWEGRTVLRRITPRGSPEAEAELADARAKLFALREARPKPGRDDKVLADWNGLTIAALARASAVFDEPAWLRIARAAFNFIMAKLRGPDGRLLHAWREGHPGARALLDDYASMARAALALFEARGEPADLEAARRLASEAIDLFGDGAGGFYLTAKDAADMPGARPRQTHDGATPSGVGLLAETFVHLWHLTDEARWGEAAEALIRAVSGAPEGLGGSPLTLMSADMLERGGSVVVDGPLDDPAAQTLAFAALRAPDPSLTVLRLDRRLWPNGSPRADLPQAADPIAMLCQGQTCSLPVTTPEALIGLMTARREGAPS